LLSDGTIEPEEESLFDKFLEKFEFTRESIKNELDALFVKNNTKVIGI
jgi:hypothetical protein